MDVILKFKRQIIGLIKYFLLKRLTLIKLGLFRFKTCPKKLHSKNFLPFGERHCQKEPLDLSKSGQKRF
jgi:hypothetical protein